MEKKTDRRVRKTKNQLRTGLARLMKKKNIGQITVKELVDDVDINRMDQEARIRSLCYRLTPETNLL